MEETLASTQRETEWALGELGQGQSGDENSLKQPAGARVSAESLCYVEACMHSHVHVYA